MKKLAIFTLGCFLAAGLAACGDVDDGTDEPAGGTPLARIHGTVQGPGGVHYTAPHVGLVWVNWGDENTLVPDFVEQVAPIDASQMPVSFSLSVFQAPPASAHNVIYDWEGENELGRLAMAFVVALDDKDGNGSFVMSETGIDAPDQLFGVSWNDALIHLPAALAPEAAAGMFSNPAAATPGFHVARFDACAGLFEIVDDGTFAIQTFPASSTFPDEGESIGEECRPDEPTGACADPEDEACWTCLDDAITGCLTVTCGTQMDALTACAQLNGCDLGADDGGEACVTANCGAEVAAIEACMYTCTEWEACY